MVSQPRSVQSSRWDGAIFLIIPDTSCLATIVLSLRDKRHSTAEALLKLAFMGCPGLNSHAPSVSGRKNPVPFAYNLKPFETGRQIEAMRMTLKDHRKNTRRALPSTRFVVRSCDFGKNSTSANEAGEKTAP
jgi:hypothetical protein